MDAELDMLTVYELEQLMDRTADPDERMTIYQTQKGKLRQSEYPAEAACLMQF